jgi:tRNA (mo5U34)-methyltransferase
MDLNKTRNELKEQINYKDNKIIHDLYLELCNKFEHISNNPLVSLDDIIKISSSLKAQTQTKLQLNKKQSQLLQDLIMELRPWRKGPFDIFDIFINSEWQSFIKYKHFEKHFKPNNLLKDKIVGDIGCNNGYYMFKMLEHKPKRLVGFDPSFKNKYQFLLMDYFIKSNIVFERLGVEHIRYYEHKFDVLFCLGVLYHRHNPIKCLKDIKYSLNKKGILFLDTLIVDDGIYKNSEAILSPYPSYCKMKNVYLIPSKQALINWLKKAGFVNIEILTIVQTSTKEQRKTKYSFNESLEDFLDPQDKNKTIEGYYAPKRIYLKASV